MAIDDLLDVAGAALLVLGAGFSLVAAVGVVRMPDLLTRMHAATKPQVLGLMLVLGGLALVLREPGAALLLVLVLLAQLVTAPVAGHMVGRASYRAGQVDHDLLVADELTGDSGDAHGPPRPDGPGRRS